MRYRRWYVHLPGEAVTNDVDLGSPGTEQEARAVLRRHLHTRRLPRGTQVWPDTATRREPYRPDVRLAD